MVEKNREESSGVRWGLDGAASGRACGEGDAIARSILWPYDIWPNAAQQCNITASEVWPLSLGLINAACGAVVSALYFIEQQLLPVTHGKEQHWHNSCVLMAASLRLYCCEPAKALQHVATARARGAIGRELDLFEGLALRLRGSLSEAAKIVQPIVPSRYRSLIDDSEVLGKALLLEIRCHERPISTRAMCWLEREDIRRYGGTAGLILAALFRAETITKRRSTATRSREAILDALDRIPLFERPFITALLADILPRPLAGVAQVEGPPDLSWQLDAAGEEIRRVAEGIRARLNLEPWEWPFS